jgi:hypothetical protein
MLCVSPPAGDQKLEFFCAGNSCFLVMSLADQLCLCSLCSVRLTVVMSLADQLCLCSLCYLRLTVREARW